MWTTDRVRSPLFHRLLSQHPAPPYAGGFFAAAIQVLHHFHGLRYQSVTRLPLAPLSGLTFRRCRIHFMLRAVVSLLFLRGLHRFSTSGCPDALDACYVASWQLPRPDLHRLVDDDFAGHTNELLGMIGFSPLSESPGNPLITASSARTRPSPGIHACKRRSARVPRLVWLEHLSRTRRRDWLQAIGAW